MKKSFTLIEIIIVIVIIAILSSIVSPDNNIDITNEASAQIISHIRYTQQLGLKDNKHRQDYDKQWQNGYWKWSWTNCSKDSGSFYTITSNEDLTGSISKTDSIFDQATGEYLYLNKNYCGNRDSSIDESTDIDLYKRFGIEHIYSSGGCSKVQNISFDYFGRPHSGNYNNNSLFFQHILHEDCILTFQYDSDKNFSITITAQTGYTYLN